MSRQKKSMLSELNLILVCFDIRKISPNHNIISKHISSLTLRCLTDTSVCSLKWRPNICLTYRRRHTRKNICILHYMEIYEPKRVNPVVNIIGVNSLRLGGLHIRNMKKKSKVDLRLFLFLLYHMISSKIGRLGAIWLEI